MLKKLRESQGFTLIELLIVVVILGVLITIVIGATSGDKAKANDAKRKADLARIQTSLEDCYGVTTAAQYPVDLTDACVTAKFDSGVAPTDPKNVSPNVYTYTPANTNTTYTLTAQMEKLKSETNIDASGLMTLKNKQ